MVKQRYYDIINIQKPKETKSGDEIVSDIVKKAGLKVI